MYQECYELCKAAAADASHFIMTHFQQLSSSDVNEKQQNDYVTFVDKGSELRIVEMIRAHFPDHAILAEESGPSGNTGEYLWVIDPLDGTTNFIHGIPHFAISIALLEKGQPLAGYIYHPVLQEEYFAWRGMGAFFQNHPIRVRTINSLNQALGATGFPFKNLDHLPAWIDMFRKTFPLTKGLRRMGSAALDMAYVAAGHFDFFWEARLCPWDYLAGILIVQEAGGIATNFAGKAPNIYLPDSIICSASTLYPLLIPFFQNDDKH